MIWPRQTLQLILESETEYQQSYLWLLNVNENKNIDF